VIEFCFELKVRSSSIYRHLKRGKGQQSIGLLWGKRQEFTLVVPAVSK
jgi:hypothetical protein